MVAILPAEPPPRLVSATPRAPAPAAWPLPCPASAGWELIATARLPRSDSDGLPLGGFSAAAVDPVDHRLWLLSDSGEPFLVPVEGLEALGIRPLRLGIRLALRDPSGQPFPHPLDGEGLVLSGEDLWIVSEGRRSTERPPQLLRFDRAQGRLRQAIPLPEPWQARPGRGLGANQGPEALALLPEAWTGGSLSLLMAAERPLLQDPAGQVRLLGYGPLAAALPPIAPPDRPAGGVAGFTALGSFDLPLEGPAWGLTEVMPLPRAGGLLGLIRGFEPPERWWSRLVLLPRPAAGVSGRPLRSWDLLAEGLPADNWEGLAPGPPLGDGRPSVLLVSDDNFSPRQTSLIARLAPRRLAPCP